MILAHKLSFKTYFNKKVQNILARAIIGERWKRPLWPLGYVNFTQVIFRDCNIC